MQITLLASPKKEKTVMSNPRFNDFKEHLDKLRKDHPLDTSAHLLRFDPKHPSSKMVCKYYMITCTADNVRENDFREFLSTQIIRYVIKSRFLNSERLKDSAYMAALYRTARRQFMKRSPTAAECGELILFVLLESQGILQILQKMPLKTHREMAFHGSDGVYIELEDNLFILHYGESKMVGAIDAGISEAVKSIENFYNADDDDEEHQLELDLVSAHIDEEKFGGFVDLIEDLVLPYGKDRSQVREKCSIFIGFTWDPLSHLPVNLAGKLTDYLRQEYPKLHDGFASKMANAVNKSKINNLYFHVQFIPFVDVVKFRNEFKAKL